MTATTGTGRRRASAPRVRNKPPAVSDGVQRATGRDRAGWFALLDAWGARGRPYREIADWLTGKQHLSKWWAQKLIVEYEQDRGVRQPGARPDGTFTVGVSRTVAVPVRHLFDAFVKVPQRARWLTDGKMSLRSARPGRSARFDWEDASSRVSVTFVGQGRAKSLVAVRHERLASARLAAATKRLWRVRLVRLASWLQRGGAD
jgi:hypothetical protein